MVWPSVLSLNNLELHKTKKQKEKLLLRLTVSPNCPNRSSPIFVSVCAVAGGHPSKAAKR